MSTTLLFLIPIGMLAVVFLFQGLIVVLFKGLIQSVALYQAALDAGIIQSHFQSGVAARSV